MNKIVGVLLAAHLAAGTLPAQAAAVAPQLIFNQRLDRRTPVRRARRRDGAG